MNLEFLELLIDAYCQDCTWSDKVADFFGYGWDEEGCALRSWVISYFIATYGERSVDWLDDFQDKGVLEYWQDGHKYTISSAEEFAHFLEKESRYIDV